MKQKLFLIIICIFTIGFISSALAQKVKVSSDSINAELFKVASINFMNGDYFHAIVEYQKLFDMEMGKATLEKQFWYVLIDNLGMAYGISGKLDKAEEVFKYGVSKDSTYPLFYYSLACTYAEREDMDNAISYLRIAYKYKDNMIANEPFPDPMSDDSFQRFVKNIKFIDAVKEMKQK